MGAGDRTNLLSSGRKEPHNSRIVTCCDVDSTHARALRRSVTAFHLERGENKVGISAVPDDKQIPKTL
jgi:hypothetical protein